MTVFSARALCAALAFVLVAPLAAGAATLPAAHSLMLDQPARFLAALDTFLSQNP